MIKAEYNRYPYSAIANATGMKELIGESQSISFDREIFDSNAHEMMTAHIKSFNTHEEGLKYLKKLSIVSCLPYVDAKADRTIRSEENHLVLIDGYGSWEINYYSIAVGKIRYSSKDERSLLVGYASKAKCLVCTSDVYSKSGNFAYVHNNSGSARQVFTMDVGGKTRSECVCSDCQDEYDMNLHFTNAKQLIQIVNARMIHEQRHK